MRSLQTLLSIPLMLVAPLAAQFNYPSAASTRLHFAQIADGGPASQRWTTTLAVANPDPSVTATVTVTFYRDNGQPLPLDFGSGAVSTLTLTLPAGGSRIVTSTGTSSRTDFVTGWARAVSSVPVFGTVLYRATVNGAPFWDVAAAGVGATFGFHSQAAPTTGIALANPNGSDTIHLRVSNRDANGVAGSDYNVTLPPLGHTAFSLGTAVPTMPRGFQGTVSVVSTDTPPAPFVALAIYERDGLLSPLPAGAWHAPSPTSRRPKDVLTTVAAGGVTLTSSIGRDLFSFPPETVVEYLRQKNIVIEESATLKATYESTDDSVHVSRALVETLGASDAALAFVVGHMVARGVLQRIGLMPTSMFGQLPVEKAADACALGMMFAAGYDPGGMADFFSRLATANGQGLAIDPALTREFGPWNQVAARQTEIWERMAQGCAYTPGLVQVCKKVHDYWHPSYPAFVP
ncbi:MAG: hypothetical protein MUC42_11825 [Bryobacter sp.]|nr:hypothetical protein [Bryobacter sp.]